MRTRNNTPTNIAMVKLASVPIITYSVVLISLALFNSPKRNIDLAAKRKPIPSKLPMVMKVSMRVRSKYPIHLPAFGRLCEWTESGIHCLRKRFNKMAEGLNINRYAMQISHKLTGQNCKHEDVRALICGTNKVSHRTAITAICAT